MKSYTLANWAGSPGRPEEKTSELPSTSLTGSSSTANSLSNTQSTSKYGGDTGDSGENVLISKDHELGWMDSSNIAVHDASIHGMSLFETQANGTMLQPHHISTPSNQVQNASSSRLVTAQNQGPNNNDALRDAGFGLYKFSVPLHADVNYGRETQPSSTAYDVSNSKPYSNSARLTPNPLSSSSTINMSLEQPIYSPNRWFIPDLTSPLHSYKSPVEPRTSPLRDIPVSPSYKSISSKHAAGPPRPRTPEVEKIDMISVYTMDADGEDDDDDVIIVENMVANPSPEKSSDVIDMHESLFTPPPSQDGWIPLENIFTPPPESSKGLPTVRRIRMDYVQVPPLKRPRSDYKPMPRPTLPRPPTEKKKRPAKHVESHSDLARAMQAAYDNNESLGTLPRNPTMVKRKVAPKPDASLSRFSSQSVVVVKPQKPPRESTASSSRFSSVSLSASRPQHPPTTSSRLSSESLSASRPQKRRTGEDQPQLQANVSKRPRVTIDLTMSDAEGGQEKARPPKRPVARTSSSAGNNALQISIAIVRPTPPDVLLHNTRFLRQHLSPAVSSGIRNATGRDISNQRQNAAGAVVARPNPSRLSHYTSTPFPQGELSLGGFLEYGDDDTEDEESEDDDDIPLVDLISRRKASMAPSTSGRCESVVPIPSGARRDSVVPLAVPHSVQVQRRGPPSHGTRKTPSTARPPTARPASTARPTSTARPSNTGASASARQSSNAQQSSTRPSGAPVIHCQVEAPISALGFLLPGRAPPREHQFVHIAAHPAPRTASASSGSQVNGHVLSQLSRPKIAPSSSGIPIAVNKSAPSHPLPPTPLRISPGPSVISHAPSPPPRPASATPDLPATPAQPSPKALGKRRAVTPPPPPIPPPHPPPDYRSQQNSDAHLLQSTKGNLDIFLHDYSPAKSADGASTSAAAHFLDQGVLPSPFPSPTAYGRLTLGGLSGPSHAYQGSLLASPGSSRPVAFLSSTFDDEQRQLDTPDPWLQFIQEDTEYEFTTVDPTLLGDHAPVVALQAPAPGTVVEPAGRDASALFDSPQLFPSSISSSRASPMSDVFDLEYQPSASMTSASAPDRAHASLSPTASDFDKLVLHRTPPRKRMERVGEVDAAAGRLSPAGDATVTSEYCSSSSSSSSSDDDLSSDGAHRRTKVTAAPGFPVANLLVSRPQAASGHQWPQNPTQGSLYCHQCRNRSNISKMACKCGKFFCARCLVTRYQERTFDLTKRQPNCPYCDQTCNCSICCVKQGKKYVSQRGKNTMRPASKRAGPLGRTTAMHIFSPLLPPSAFVRPPQATQYWGTVYSVDRGRKLGAAFTQPGADGLPPVVYASAVAQSTRPRPRPEKPARVFVGKVQRAWGFGRHPYVVNIPPPALSPSRSVKRRRGVVSMPGRVRCIVGNADVLRYPVRTYNDDLLAGLSPLTSIDDSDEDSNGNGTVGEQPLAAAAAAVSEEVFVPGSLEERDVARAIAASFRALGIAFIVEDIPSY